MTESRCEDLRARLEQRFVECAGSLEVAKGEVTLTVSAERLQAIALELRDAADLSFKLLIDLSGVDYATYGQADWRTHDASSTGFSRAVSQSVEDHGGPAFPARFAAVYHLLSVSLNFRLRLRVWAVGEPPLIPTVTEIWPAADWYEREAFDLYGILFEGHPDLRRILTDYGFIGHPFRKDFPLEGHVEVRYDPDKQRVVYQPVSIENRTLVPRVIRGDSSHGH